jgi:hypothetical protein
MRHARRRALHDLRERAAPDCEVLPRVWLAGRWIASLQLTGGLPSLRSEQELIGTVGDRISLDRFESIGGESERGFELEHIGLNEVDAEGRLRAVMLFDPADRRARRRALRGAVPRRRAMISRRSSSLDQEDP